MSEQHHEVPDLRGKRVKCTRCERSYICMIFDDFYDPRDELGWHAGGVCYGCLIELYEAFKARFGDRPFDARVRNESVFRQRRMDAALRGRGRRV